MADKSLQAADWKKFAKGRELDDAALLRALTALERAEKGTPAVWQQALDDIDKALAALRKGSKALKSDRDLVERLGEMESALAAARKAAQAAAKQAEEDEDEDEAPDVLTTKLVPLLRQVPKGVALHALILLAGKETAVMLARRPIPAARGKLLKTYLGVSSGTKLVPATCVFENNVHTFVVQGAPAAGLAKRLKAALLAQIDRKMKLRVRGDSPDDIDEDLEGDDADLLEMRGRMQDAAADVQARTSAAAEETATMLKAAAEETAAAMARAIQPSADPAVLKALITRFNAVRAELDRVKALDTPIGGDIRQRLAQVTDALRERRSEGVEDQLGQLEQIAAAVAARRGGGNAAATQAKAQIDQRKQDYDTDRAAAADAIDAAEKALADNPELQPQAVANRYAAARQIVDDAVAAEDWLAARDALSELEEAADDVVDQDRQGLAVGARHAELKDLIDRAWAVKEDADGPLLELAEALQEASDEFDYHVRECNWDDAMDWLESMGRRSQRLLDLEAKLRQLMRMLQDNQVDLERAAKLLDTQADRFPKPLQDQFKKFAADFAALQKQATVNVDDWQKALERLVELTAKVLAVQAQWQAYQTELSQGLDDVLAAQALELNGALFPDGALDAFQKGRELHHEKSEVKDWPGAQDAIKTCKREALTLVALIGQGDAYYAAFKPHGAVIAAANKLADDKSDRLAVPLARYLAEYTAIQKDVAACAWTAARDKLPAQVAAGQALIDAHAAIKDDRARFEKSWAALTKLAQARQVAARPPAGLDTAALDGFRRAHTPANDARNRGDYAAATPLLEPLEAAISALLSADARLTEARQAYELALAGVGDLAAARQLSAGKPASLAGPCAEFDTADGVVRAAAAEGRYGDAKAACTPLAAALKGLLEARLSSNQGAPTTVFVALAKRLEPLQDRLKAAKPNPGKEVAFLDALKTQLAQAYAAALLAIKNKQRVEAELAVAGIEPLLVRCEQGTVRLRQHIALYVAARDGAVKQVRALNYGSPALGKLRDAALTAQDKRIQALGSAGQFDEGDREVQAWRDMANAWAQASDAFWTLLKNSGAAPDGDKLQTLAALPGGGKVLDTLMAELPEDKPQSFVKEAMKARYGFEVKQFKKKNPDRLSDLSDLEAVADSLPDKSLKALYGMLGEVPIAHIKGKVSELVRFTEEKGGAAYGSTEKKVYMYCGRSDDPKATQQQFGVEGDVLPPGEVVDEACEPANKDPVPYFKFAAWHEVGHAEDDAGDHMTRLKGIAGWTCPNVEEVARVAAAHLKYDEGYVLAMLRDKASKPPTDKPAKPDDMSQADWDDARVRAEEWCRAVREDTKIWNHGSRSKERAINGRVYHEAYADDWVSYDFSARAQGITGYQFRAPGEWFAELYAAYYAKKLKPSHPAMAWLTTL